MKPLRIDAEAELQRGHIAASCREIYRRGWMEGTSGNVSLRSGQAVLISATGRGKGRMSRRDTVLVDPVEGLPVAGETEWPSAETAIHLAVYRRRPDCGAVVHAHPPYATAVAALADVGEAIGQVVFEDLELSKGLGVQDPSRVELPVFRNWPDVTRIAADVDTYLAKHEPHDATALLISRHGVTTWGRDLEQAGNRLECVESLCRLLLLMDSARRPADRAEPAPAVPFRPRRHPRP